MNLIKNSASLLDKLTSSRFIYLFTLLLCLAVFSISPDTDKDVYRYKWDGYVTSESGNPYTYTPNELESLASTFPYWSEMQFKEYHTPYPPVSQFLFWLDHEIFGFSIIGIKIVMTAFVLGCVYILRQLLETFALPKRNVLFFIANPLVIYESVGTVHNDSIMVFFFVTSLYFLFSKKKLYVFALLLGLSILSKLITLLAVPVLLAYVFQTTNLKKTFHVSLMLFTTLLIGYLPFAFENYAVLFESLRLMAQSWVYSPGLFVVLEWAIGSTAAKFISFGILILLVLLRTYKILTIKHVSWKNVLTAILVILGWFIISSAAVFPWYLLWIAWLIPFIPKPLPWIVLTISTTIAITLQGNHQGEGLLRQGVMWAPFYVALLYDYIIQPYTSQNTVQKSYQTQR